MNTLPPTYKDVQHAAESWPDAYLGVPRRRIPRLDPPPFPVREEMAVPRHRMGLQPWVRCRETWLDYTGAPDYLSKLGRITSDTKGAVRLAMLDRGGESIIAAGPAPRVKPGNVTPITTKRRKATG